MSTRPAEVFSPGEFLRDELEARGWSQQDLATILARPLQSLNAILHGRKRITPETAIGLAAALGTSADLWLELESAYRLSLEKPDDGDVARRARLFEIAPIHELIRRGWITDTANLDRLEKELLEFLEIQDLDAAPDLPAAPRMSSKYHEPFSREQVAWLSRVRSLGRSVRVAKFNASSFQRGLVKLRMAMGHRDAIRELPERLAELGVVFLVVEHLPKSKIDGATVWLKDSTPIIALTLRYDRIDSFWFTLAHELMHVKHHDGNCLDSELVGETREAKKDKPEFEKRADREATEFLLPSKELARFSREAGLSYSKVKIEQFAEKVGVPPGIVVGQLQHRGELKFSQGRELLVKVRATLLETALTDGWGTKPKIAT